MYISAARSRRASTELPLTSLPGTGNRRRIYLLRHGAVEYLNPDGSRVSDPRGISLNAHGREQAARLAALLHDVDLVDGRVLRRCIRLTNLTPCNLTKEGLCLTTMERIVADRNRRRG